MRAQDIVDRLSAVVPLHTTGFSNSVAISSVTVSGTTATATTATAHGLVDGQNVAVSGVGAPVQIDAGTFLRTGSTATFETLQDHDLTLSERDTAAGGKTVTLSGANEAEFVGTFSLLKVVNRRKLIIAVADSGPTTISGSPQVDDANGAVFNGLVPASNVTPTTFDYELPTAYPLDGVAPTNWAQVGNGLTIVGSSTPALSSLSSNRVAFIDEGNDELRTYDFDGTNWAQVGNGLAIAAPNGPALASLSGNRVAFIDGGNDELRTYDFDGTNWVQVGNSLAIAGTDFPALAALGGSAVAFIDGGNDELRTYDFDGTNWVQVGNGLAIANLGIPAIAALPGNRVAFVDNAADTLRTYHFDGTNWVQVGNGLPVAVPTPPGLAALSGTQVAFASGGTLQTYEFDGIDWAPSGSPLSLTIAGFPALAALSGTRIAYKDSFFDLRAFDFSATDGAVAQISIRILSVLDIEQYLRDVYTRKGLDEDVLVVQLGDVTQSKKRNEETDAASSSSAEYAFNPVLIQPFAVYIVMNVTDQLTASMARDQVEDEYIPAIFKAVLRAKFASGFTYSSWRATFTGHGVFAYSDINGKNKALYAHEVSFEQLAQLTTVDAVGPDGTVAMRDVSYTLATDLGTGVLTADVDLDEEPIP